MVYGLGEDFGGYIFVRVCDLPVQVFEGGGGEIRVEENPDVHGQFGRGGLGQGE